MTVSRQRRRETIDALHPGSFLPRFVFIEGGIDAAQCRLQGNSGLAPGLNQRPIERGKQQKRPTPLLKALLNLGKIIKVVKHASILNSAHGEQRWQRLDLSGSASWAVPC